MSFVNLVFRIFHSSFLLLLLVILIDQGFFFNSFFNVNIFSAVSIILFYLVNPFSNIKKLH